MTTYTITKKREGRFNDQYTVTADGIPLVTDVAYLRARRVLHERGVSGEKRLEMVDGLPVGTAYVFDVR